MIPCNPLQQEPEKRNQKQPKQCEQVFVFRPSLPVAVPKQCDNSGDNNHEAQKEGCDRKNRPSFCCFLKPAPVGKMSPNIRSESRIRGNIPILAIVK
jgi:hypothetical protein